MAIYCNNCNGDIIGDGYNSVMHCEFADDDKVHFCAGDEGPVLCDYEEPDTDGGNWQDEEAEKAEKMAEYGIYKDS